MPRYEIHQIRKDLLARAAHDEDARSWLRECLVLLECLDWNKKEKTLISQSHLKNWLTAIGQSYGCEAHDLHTAAKYMTLIGIMTYERDNRGQITLAVSDIPIDEPFDSV